MAVAQEIASVKMEILYASVRDYEDEILVLDLKINSGEATPLIVQTDRRSNDACRTFSDR